MHNNKAIDYYPLVFYQEGHAGGDDVFIFIGLQQWLPFQISGGEELWILCDERRYGFKLREVVLISVVGDACTQNCGTTPTTAQNG
jgi:hypothetical protein